MNRSILKEKLTLAAGVGLMISNRALMRFGLRKRADGWRRGAGLVLRGEAATFVLSTFGLDVWSDTTRPASPSIEESQRHCAQRLRDFLANESNYHLCVKRGEIEDRVERTAGASFTLDFQAWRDGPDRFIRPDHWAENTDRTLAPLFKIVCRINNDNRADVWFLVNHIGIDGVPAQELVSRLEAAWGASSDLRFPTPEEFASHHGPRECIGRSDLVEMQAFIDFTPLLGWRKRENARLPETMTVNAALLWCLAQHETFANICIGTTVEIPAVAGLGRGVSIIVVRPADYSSRADGLARFVHEFNRQLELIRTRSSEGCKALDAIALVPPTLARAVLHHALKSPRSFGSVGVTILKDAHVFGAPMGDAGHPRGFIAVGSVALPTSDGRKVACITIKGPPAIVSDYPRHIQQAIDRAK